MSNREKIDNLIDLFMDEMDKLGVICIVGGIDTETDTLINMSNSSSIADLLEVVCYSNAIAASVIGEATSLLPQVIATDMYDVTLDMIDELKEGLTEAPAKEFAAKLVVAKKKNDNLN
jgi:hypothetical protein